jgi:hypothetical protein
MESLLNCDLLREAVLTARNDGEIVERFQEGKMPIEDVVRLVSRDIWNIHKRRLFDELFYEPQLTALASELRSFPEFTRVDESGNGGG